MSPTSFPSTLVEFAQNSNAWPFEEARKLQERVKRLGRKEVLFETGYGPSGLPHIGTFGEVARTSMVRFAFRLLTEDTIPTRLYAFSDDMDGFRKVPENVPQQDMLKNYIGQPLTKVPDPFGTHDSFGAHNNARLQEFLNRFGFSYEFQSATSCYQSGRFDQTLLKILEHYDEVMTIMLSSLRDERQQTYSPFLPIHPRDGRVMQVAIEEIKRDSATIIWKDPETNEYFETPVTGGHSKLQWKPDWAMRWVALEVDYEMAGKDLIDSVKLSGRIARCLGGEPPEGFNYELFLDDEGKKISKSKGNGLSIDEWLTYAPPESLSLFMYNKPREAKRLYFDVIPKNVDDYLTFLEKYPSQDEKNQLMNPVWHIHSGRPPQAELLSSVSGGKSTSLTYAMLLNLVAVANSEDPIVLWGFIKRYAPTVSPETHPNLDRLVQYATRFYRDFVRPQKTYRLAEDSERIALEALLIALEPLKGSTDAESLQSVVYEIGRTHFPDLSGKSKSPDGRPGVSQQWFAILYQILLGQERGPRFGSFIALYGVEETMELIKKALNGDVLKEHEEFLKTRN